MSEEICEVVITAATAGWLTSFVRDLVTDRLAACGQTVTPIRSIYRWNDTVEDEPEARVALHTRISLVPAIIARTDELHDYDVPCVIALPIAAANPRYTDWVLAQTREP